jgi:hypothetical protein
MKNWFFFTFFLFSALSSPALQFKDRLKNTNPGDYIVVQAGKTLTLLAIRDNNGKTLTFEEISAPLQDVNPASWPEWVQTKAPGHTSWTMTEVDLNTGEILECYSFSRCSWTHVSPQESLLAGMLNLSMRHLPKDDLRKIGPPPLEGEPDRRKIWTPPFVYESKKITNTSFEAFAVTWPNDDSELSNKDAILYFDQEKKTHLPFWIDIETTHLTISLKTIDSGKNLPAIYKTLPKRAPEFLGSAKKTKTGITLCIKSSKRYKDFDLFAIDITTAPKELSPMEHTVLETKEELVIIEVPETELLQNLKPTHRYKWMLVPRGSNELYTQSATSFLWEPKGDF